jgi:hypothetical protein
VRGYACGSRRPLREEQRQQNANRSEGAVAWDKEGSELEEDRMHWR